MTAPFLPVPPSIRLVAENKQNDDDVGSVTDEEIRWMLARRSVSSAPAPQKLALDYGAAEAVRMIEAFRAGAVPERVFGVLNWPGVATRWRQFVPWFVAHRAQLASLNAEAVFRNFAQHLGRVTTYRALALDEAALNKIIEADAIFPTGQLRYSADELCEVIETHGVRKILVARLFIGHLVGLIGKDPSISLHDDWQTTCAIASGYAAADKSRNVFLFEVSVPVIQHHGWRLIEVASFAAEFLGPRYREHPVWFDFSAPCAPKGVSFDSSLVRTERYGFYGVPFLRKTMTRLWRFESVAQIAEAIAPFVESQAMLRERYPDGEGAPAFGGPGM